MKRLISALLCLAACQLFGALPATGVINIQSTATAGNVNGAGFNAARGGVNYSLQNAAQLTGTDGSAAGGTTFTSVSGGFTTVMGGNYIHLTASTGLTVGWYEIVTRTDTNNVVLDRSPGTGTLTTYFVGGAASLASTLDDDLFEIGVAGNIFYAKGAVTYTLGEAVAVSATGGASAPIAIKGYTTTQGDVCNGSNRPIFACGANAFSVAANWDTYNVSLTGTGAQVHSSSTASKVINCKAINSSTTAGRVAFAMAGDSLIYNSEAISYRGRGITGATLVEACWVHDSDTGVRAGGGTAISSIRGSIISSCVTTAIDSASAQTGRLTISGNTLFGSTNTTGIGVTLVTGSTDIGMTNNIITGFVTGVSHADVQTVGFDDYNDYFNNDTDVTLWTKGSHDSAVAPSFTNVGQVTGATATTTSGNHLVQSGATFITSGVTAGRDYVYVISGTGVTAGIYGIASVDSETQITTDIALTANATGDKVFQITTGQNFAIGSALKALGFPGAFQGGYSTGYTDQGAVPRQEPSGGGAQVSYGQSN